MKHFENITDLNQHFNLKPQHPLFDIRDYSELAIDQDHVMEPIICDFYKISYIENYDGFLSIGQTQLRGNDGVLYFVEPGQLYSCNSSKMWTGLQILIHPDIYRLFTAEKNIKTYSFFSYAVNESLLLTAGEKTAIQNLIESAHKEMNGRTDDYSTSIALSYIGTLLNLTHRFYDRQFEEQKTVCNQLVGGFYDLLKKYYASPEGVVAQPTVLGFAEQLNVTPNYLGDAVRHHAGRPALSIIQEHIIDEAKRQLSTTNHTVSEVAFALGFEYPTYFSRLFKKKTNLSPSQFRKSVKSI